MMIWNERFITAADGARLFCRIAGAGAPLLLIHGAACDSDFFLALGERMSRSRRVILYDRRGYGRSEGGTGSAPGDSGACFKLQASDAACVLRQTGAEQGAAVLGCSFGALAALTLAHDYPGLANRVLMHEPPAYSLMPDDADGWERIRDIAQSIEQKKFNRALNRFLLFLASASSPGEQPMTEAEEKSFMRNGLYFIEHEFHSGFDPELEVPPLSGQTNPAVLRGARSRGMPLWECARRLAERQGCALIEVPGGHNGARDYPAQFGDALEELLSGRAGATGGQTR